MAPETIETLKRAGYPLFLWAPNTEDDIRSSLQKNPYGVISDEPILTKRLRDAL